MKRLYKATMYRMFMSKGVRVSVGLTYLSAALYYIFAVCIANGNIDASNSGNITAFGDAMIMWLFGSLIVGILVGTDFESKTIHGSLRYGRKAIILNYILVFATIILILLLPYTIGSACLIASNVDITGAKGTIISIYMGNVFDYTNDIAGLLLSYIAYIFVYIGQIAICIPVAVKFKKSIVVTAFGFMFGMFTALIASVAKSSDILELIYKFTPYDYGISKIGCNAMAGDMVSGIVVSIVFAGICGILAWLVFRRADVK